MSRSPTLPQTEQEASAHWGHRMAYNILNQDDMGVQLDDSSLGTPASPSEQQPMSSFPPLSSDPGNASKLSDDAEPPVTRSREGSIPMRHPTPDLQSLQGAYVSNVERLEQSAERLSLSSDIGEEIRKIKLEQRRSESRRSSMQCWQTAEGSSSSSFHRQLSYGQGSYASHSIIDTNNVARSGGFSPAGYYASPRGSVRSGSWSQHNSVKGRSNSQGQRLTQVTEPEQEGKPLESFLSAPFIPVASPSESVFRPLQVTNGGSYNLNDVVIPQTQSLEPESEDGLEDGKEEPRASVDTYRQTNGLFSDFDGTHTETHLNGIPLETQQPIDQTQGEPNTQ